MNLDFFDSIDNSEKNIDDVINPLNLKDKNFSTEGNNKSIINGRDCKVFIGGENSEGSVVRIKDGKIEIGKDNLGVSEMRDGGNHITGHSNLGNMNAKDVSNQSVGVDNGINGTVKMRDGNKQSIGGDNLGTVEANDVSEQLVGQNNNGTLKMRDGNEQTVRLSNDGLMKANDIGHQSVGIDNGENGIIEMRDGNKLTIGRDNYGKITGKDVSEQKIEGGNFGDMKVRDGSEQKVGSDNSGAMIGEDVTKQSVGGSNNPDATMKVRDGDLQLVSESNYGSMEGKDVSMQKVGLNNEGSMKIRDGEQIVSGANGVKGRMEINDGKQSCNNNFGNLRGRNTTVEIQDINSGTIVNSSGEIMVGTNEINGIIETSRGKIYIKDINLSFERKEGSSSNITIIGDGNITISSSGNSININGLDINDVNAENIVLIENSDYSIEVDLLDGYVSMDGENIHPETIGDIEIYNLGDGFEITKQGEKYVGTYLGQKYILSKEKINITHNELDSQVLDDDLV